jgi:hypothetical protein
MPQQTISQRLTKALARYHARRVALAAFDGVPYKQRARWWERARADQPAVYWDKQRPGFAFVNTVPIVTSLPTNYRPAGLRKVGNVVPDPGDRNSWWFPDQDPLGWYTNDDGVVGRDGDGLVWGVVYRLSGRNGLTRLVAGYQFGGVDDGPTVDFTTIFEDIGGVDDGGGTPPPVSMEAARHADQLAQEAAGKEREYRASQAEEDASEDAA